MLEAPKAGRSPDDLTTLLDGRLAHVIVRIPNHATLVATASTHEWVLPGMAPMTPRERANQEQEQHP